MTIQCAILTIEIKYAASLLLKPQGYTHIYGPFLSSLMLSLKNPHH